MELLASTHAAVWLLFCLGSLTGTKEGKLMVVPMDGSHWQSLKTVVERLAHNGHQIIVSLLHNKQLIQDLQEETFDAVLNDPAFYCGVIIAEYLRVPSIHFLRGLACEYEYISAQGESPLSFVPR
ncbi:UDP-glucuronosyltransferase 1A8 [Xenopus laevis]|uniref:UDP-glucuronosyltransferase 1A8 n=1 Tax=Xenopus laevis TaxID=8355 RepID=A0A8J1LT34_XENLA|nr:UDP-glucuronosyltransferase 1A8 [Xenopus laevis]